jgi:hypothetical protein
MPQTSIIRCALAASLMSAVVGGLAYGTASIAYDRKIDEFRELASDECMANDPFAIREEDVDQRIRRLQSLHRLCHYSLTGEIES